MKATKTVTSIPFSIISHQNQLLSPAYLFHLPSASAVLVFLSVFSASLTTAFASVLITRSSALPSFLSATCCSRLSFTPFSSRPVSYTHLSAITHNYETYYKSDTPDLLHPDRSSAPYQTVAHHNPMT